MERYTDKVDEYGFTGLANKKTIGAALHRLFANEGTNLTPEQIAELQAEN
jgi:hypothetical protein